MIDWSVVPDFSNKIGRTGYSRRALLKAIFVQKVKGFTVRELIHFLKNNPSFAKCIGFDPIINYVPSEATFSSFKKEFNPSYLDKVLVLPSLKVSKRGSMSLSSPWSPLLLTMTRIMLSPFWKRLLSTWILAGLTS